METRILYSKTKTDKIQTWQARTEAEKLIVVTGFTDGKKTERTTICKPKNIGKKNETTAAEQAVLEAHAKYEKKLKENYRENIEALAEVELRPMLLQDYKKNKHKICWPCSGQPKLDGIRCFLFYSEENTEPTLKSRNGTEYKVPSHLVQLIKEKLPKRKEPYDGEIYKHGMFLQDIKSGLAPKNGIENNFTKLLEYHIFDLPDTKQKCSARLAELKVLSWPWIVENFELKDEAAATEKMGELALKGYEGLVLRNHDGFYEYDTRSADVQKFKPLDSDEFEIVGKIAAKPVFKEDGTKLESFVFLCKTKTGAEFEVRLKGKDELRHQIATLTHEEFAKKYIGKLLTVNYLGFTKDQIPNHGVGITVRDYE